MGLGKVVLIFQAVITVILGIVFLTQISALNTQSDQTELNLSNPDDMPKIFGLDDLKTKFVTAGYVLLIVAIIEFVIISRFV